MNQRISRQELLRRINDQLKEKHQELIECQHLCQSCSALGDYYLKNLMDNSVIKTNVDLQEFALDQECLADSEIIDD